jgi:thiamine-phosphate pyrophosphorylase
MIVAITDRRLMKPEDAARAGADLVQVREKDLDGGALLAFVRSVMATGVRVVVNDRVDVALAAGAYGVHLPERGLSIADARALGATFVGVSRHTLDGVREAVDADLVQLGPIWRTPGKGEPLGPLVLEGARAILDAAGSKAKLVAVGGIETPEHVKAARRAGADGVAAIRAAWSARSSLRSSDP